MVLKASKALVVPRPLIPKICEPSERKSLLSYLVLTVWSKMGARRLAWWMRIGLVLRSHWLEMRMGWTEKVLGTALRIMSLRDWVFAVREKFCLSCRSSAIPLLLSCSLVLLGML